MKNTKFFFTLFILIFISSFASAQKFGVVDSELILKQMKDYKEAQKEISRISIEYQKEIEKMQMEHDSLVSAFEEEEILLTEEMKEKRLKVINEKKQEIKDKQRKIFGFEGLIFLKRQELIKPVQEKVFSAIEKVAQKEKLQVVFDKSSDLTILYMSKTHDYTEYVLEELELKEKTGDKK